MLKEKIAEYGGACNAHLHLDRSDTYDGRSESFSLDEKQDKIKNIHEIYYTEHRLKSVAEKYLTWLKDLGYRSAWSCIDVDGDIGTVAFDTFDATRKDVGFDLKIAAYSPTTFEHLKDVEMFESVLDRADYICALPEKAKNFDMHCEYMLSKSHEHKKPIHLHLDQSNSKHSFETERFLDIVEKNDTPLDAWIIHAISPSCYQDKRFFRIIDMLLKNDIGIICCPSAALGMHQDRDELTPTHNSIARVIEMKNAGVKIMLGSDNICDIFSPSTTPDLLHEILLASNALRFYDVSTWAEIACGIVTKKTGG